MNYSENKNKKMYKEKLPYELNGKYNNIYNTKKYNMDKKLSISSIEAEVLDGIENNDILIVIGGTGCGKSTQVPKLLLSKYDRIICSQPRRVAAVSISEYLSRSIDSVGYKIRFEANKPNSRLLFVTDGILLKECFDFSEYDINSYLSQEEKCKELIDLNDTKEEPFGESGERHFNYDVVVIDEVHERSINTDLFLSYFSVLKRRNPKIKLVLMTATMNFSRMEEYFSFYKIKKLEVKEIQFSKKIFYLKERSREYFPQTLNQVKKILKSTNSGDILVFLTGRDEIERFYEILKDGLDYIPVKIYGEMNKEEQLNVFKSYGKRKVILATNIAETTITIPGLKYVVDSGRVKTKVFDLIEKLQVQKISKAQANQRAGRVGRTMDGIVYRIYSKEEYEELLDESIPECKRMDISKVILLILILSEKDRKKNKFLSQWKKNTEILNETETVLKKVNEFDFIEEFTPSNITQGIVTLAQLGAIKDGMVTKDGHIMAHLPLTVALGKTLLSSLENQSIDEVLKIISILTTRNLIRKKTIVDPQGDLFTYLKIFNLLESSNFKISIAKKYYLNPTSIKEVQNTYQQLTESLQLNRKSNRKFKYKDNTQNYPLKDPITVKDKDEQIYKIFESFFSGHPNSIAKKDKDVYFTTFNNTYMADCFIHPESSLYNTLPPIILYTNIIKTKRTYLSGCMKINEDHYKKYLKKYKKL